MDFPVKRVALGATNGEQVSLVGTFAVVRMWPELAVAEHENIARFRASAERLGVGMIEIDSNGYILPDLSRRLGPDDADFVIHFHFSVPKAYDCYSYGALWNPIDYVFDWDYARSRGNKLSHDHFVSTGSRVTEDLVLRERPGEFTPGCFPIVNHTLGSPLIEPALRSDRRVFYCGINWERLRNVPGRHSGLLKELDARGLIDIFGPRKIGSPREIAPWEGYQCYRGELPFDGTSVVEAISRAGIALVLSSDEHKRSNIASNRLFEALAAGSLIIADDHPFISEHFEGCTLPLDLEQSPEQQVEQVLSHVRWANANPERARSSAAEAQRRFKESFLLDAQLGALYQHYASHKAATRRPLVVDEKPYVSVLYVPLTDDPAPLRRLAERLSVQTSQRFELLVPVPDQVAGLSIAEILSEVVPGKVRTVVAKRALTRPRSGYGELIDELLARATGEVFVVSHGCDSMFARYVETIEADFVDGGPSVVKRPYLAEGAVNGRLTVTLTDCCAVPAITGFGLGIDRRAYQQHRTLLTYLGCDKWLTAVASGLLGEVVEKHVPMLIADTAMWNGLVSGRTESAPVLSAPHQDKIMHDYLRSQGVSTEVAGPREFLSISGEQRERAAVDLIKALPLPSWAVGALKFFYQMTTGRARRRRKQLQSATSR